MRAKGSSREFDTLLTLREVSEILNVSIQTLRKWCNDGKIEHIRLPNNHRRIPAREIQRILSERNNREGSRRGD